MEILYKCQISNQYANKICISADCYQYPFICSTCQKCQKLHFHNKKFQITQWKQILNQLQKIDNLPKNIFDLSEWIYKNGDRFIQYINEKIRTKMDEFNKKVMKRQYFQQIQPIMMKIKNKEMNKITGKQIKQLYQASINNKIFKSSQYKAEIQNPSTIKQKIQHIFTCIQQEVELQFDVLNNKIITKTQQNQHQNSKIEYIDHQISTYLTKLSKLYNLKAKTLYNNNNIDLNQVIKQFNKSISLDASNIDSYIGRSQIFIQLGLNHQAFNDYNKILQYQSNNSIIYFKRALLKQKFNDLDAAIQDYTKCISLNSYQQAYLKRGILFEKMNKLKQAESDYLSYQKINKTTEIYNRLGFLQLKYGEIDKCQIFLLKSVQLEQSNVDSLIGLGIINFKRKQFSKSIEYFNNVLKKQQNWLCFYYRAIINEYLQNYDGVQSDYDSSLLINNKLPDIYFNKANFISKFKSKNNSQVHLTLQKGISIAKSNSIGYYLLARYYQLQYKYQFAQPNYKLCIERQINVSAAYCGLANIYYIQKKIKQAEIAYSKSIQLNNEFEQAYNNRAVLYYESNKINQAILDLKKSIEINGKNMDSIYSLGRIYFNIKEFKKCLIYYTKIIELELQRKVKVSKSYNNRGIVYYFLDEFDKSQTDFQTALQIQNNEQYLYNLGMLNKKTNNLQKALYYFNQYYQKDKNRISLYKQRATTYLQLKKYNQAEADFNKFIQLNQSQPQLYYQRAKLYQQLQDIDKQQANLNKAIQLDKQNGLYYFQRGKIYQYKKINVQKALSDYSNAIKYGQNIYEVYHHRGILYSSLQRQSQALSDFDQYLKYNKNNEEIYIEKARIYNTSRTKIQFSFNLQQAEKINPKNHKIYLQKAEFYFGLRLYNESLTECQKGLQIVPNSLIFLWKKVQIYEALGNYQVMNKLLVQIININPKKSEAYLKLAYNYEKLQNIQLAIKNYQETIKLDINNSKAYSSLGRIYMIKKNYEKALTNFNLAIRYNNQLNCEVYFFKAQTLKELKKYEQAVNHYSHYLTLKNDSKAFQQRGIILYEFEKFKQAQLDLSKAIQLDIKNWRAYNYKGMICFKTGKYKQSQLYFTKCIQLNNKYEKAYMNRAITYKKLERYEEALNDINKSLQLNPTQMNIIPIKSQIQQKLKHHKAKISKSNIRRNL